jgi:AAA+ superfamily predicted ATPase
MGRFKFNIGDEVRMTEDAFLHFNLYTFFDSNEQKKLTGIVVVTKKMDGLNLYGVRFNSTCPKFNSLNGSLSHPFQKSGLFLKSNELVLVKKAIGGTKTTDGRKKIQFKPGMSVSEYVTKLLKKEKDKDRVKWLKTFQNCVLPDEVKEMIDEALTVVLRRDMFSKWGLDEHFEKGITNSILLYGPPGTGKTMVSESIAAVLGKNLMVVDNATIQSNIPGRTEQNITKCFNDAKKKDAVLMVDECDSLLYDRNAVGFILSSQINHLLSEIERFDGVIILTTNRLHRLDEALQRRIIAKVELKTPTKEARREIWSKLIPKKMPVEKKIDYNELAEYEMTGGDIKNAILLASRKAIAKNNKMVRYEDFKIGVDNVLKGKSDFNDVKPGNIADRLIKDYTNMNLGGGMERDAVLK